LDTRWRNRGILAAWALLFTFGIGGILNALSDGSAYAKKDYFQTAGFEHQLDRFVDYLVLFELNDVPLEEAKERLEVTADEIEQYRYRDGGVAQRIEDIHGAYDDRIEEAKASGAGSVADFYVAERERKIEEAKLEYTSDEAVRAKLLKEKEASVEAHYRSQERLRAEFRRLQETFAYSFTDIETGESFENGGFERSEMLFVREYRTLTTEDRPFYFYYAEPRQFPVEAGAFEGRIGVRKTAPATSFVMEQYQDFPAERFAFFLYAALAASALFGCFRLYRKHSIPALAAAFEAKLAGPYSGIPMDVRAVLFAISVVASIGMLFSAEETVTTGYVAGRIGGTLFNLLLGTGFVSLTLLQARMLRSHVGSRASWRTALAYRATQRLKAAFRIRSVAARAFLPLGASFLLGAGLLMVAAEEDMIFLYFPMAVLLGAPLAWFVVKRAGDFNRIALHARELAKGNPCDELRIRGNSALATLAADVNTLAAGVKASRSEQAKSERLKTELVTNVSHDLRTPLTSIINYAKLLKQEHVTEEDREAYIEIIDRKSQRLKALIDDLFEASKMASGHVHLARERIDLVQLLQQALAENNEAIRSSTLQFRVTAPDEPVYALVDGQKLWRVFDNLIGNCLKYAMEHTRVYIAATATADQAVITFKNVSKYELNENVDELFERFKRGDASRHTEGSGLGLAIAKSIVELHEGRLELAVDGDLVKAAVTLPIEPE